MSGNKAILCLVVSILVFSFPQILGAQSAADKAKIFFDEANKAVTAGRHEDARRAFQDAEKTDPGSWRYSYMYGAYLMDTAKMYEEAIAAFERAWNKGYVRGVTLQNIGKCLFYLGKFEKALEKFDYSIEVNNNLLLAASGKDADQLKFQIGDGYLWKTKVYEGRQDWEPLYANAVEGIKYDPANRWFPRLIADAALNAGHIALGNGDYDKASRYYRLSMQDPVNGAARMDMKWDDYIDWRIPNPTLIEVTENRKRLGTINPEYIHRILVLFIADQNVTVEKDGKKEVISRTINDEQVKRAEERCRWLKQIIESISDGKLSISYTLAVDSTHYEYAGETRPGWIGDRKIIFEHINDFDTLFRCWAYGEGLGTGGAGGIELIPGVLPSVLRGTVNFHPEHSRGLWLHEFFHVVEWMAGISPTHGYYEEPRVNFPGWKGPTNNQLDYFRWHFRTSVAAKGFVNMIFRNKYKAPEIPRENFLVLYDAYRGIPIEKREEANRICEEARSILPLNPEKAIPLYKQALTLSPYQPEALRSLASYYHKREKDFSTADTYYRKLFLTISPKEAETLKSEFYRDFGR